jgi:hypothetical protein
MVRAEALPFSEKAIRAFPFSARAVAEDAVRGLTSFVDDSYRKSSIEAMVLGKTVEIPKRIHFVAFDEESLRLRGGALLALHCLRTRGTDGYMRHASLRRLLDANEPWALPFVVLLAGEYVVELIEDMTAALPRLDRSAYRNFVLENRPVMRRLRAQATSYWNCYYRPAYPDRGSYPGLVFLHELERWAV